MSVDKTLEPRIVYGYWPCYSDRNALVVLDPKQPFSGPEIEGLHAFARRGGRLLVSPSLDQRALGGPGSMTEFLAEYGIQVQAGLVANPIADSLGNPREGDSRCSMLFIGPEGMDRKHPVTESLWSLQRRVVLPQSRCFMRGTAPENGVLLDLLRSSQVVRDKPSITNKIQR